MLMLVRNGGVVRSDLSGEILYKPQKSQKGITPNPNEWQIVILFLEQKAVLIVMLMHRFFLDMRIE